MKILHRNVIDCVHQLCSRESGVYTMYTSHTIGIPLRVQESAVTPQGLLCYDYLQVARTVTEVDRE
jgi:hypothetical protein